MRVQTYAVRMLMYAMRMQAQVCDDFSQMYLDILEARFQDEVAGKPYADAC
jgi:hypothetical protein